MFSPKKWIEKSIKAVIAALVGYLGGPQITWWAAQFGITVDPTQAQAGLFALWLSGVNWVKHQSWYAKLPAILRWVL